MNLAALTGLEVELRKCCAYPYHWAKVQDDAGDRLTRFVYREPTFAVVNRQIAQLPGAWQGYARARWLNFWSAQGVQTIFASHPRVKMHPDKRHRSIDFYIDGIPFDHKTSVFPEAFPDGIDAALQYPRALVDWFYGNQSTGQRHHSDNRLFIVLYDDQGEHWRLKAELRALSTSIYHYLDDFEPSQLHQMQSGSLADCIWHMTEVPY